MLERNPHDLLNQLEDILNSDPLIDEVGFIHPSQFITLNEETGAFPSSVGTILRSEDAVLRSGASKVNPSATVFWCRDHKLGISTQVLLALYNAAKHAFMAALERYKTCMTLSVKKDKSGGNDTPSCFSSSLDILESEVMKHSRTLLLLSCDFGTAWNSRKRVLSTKQNFQIFVDELFLSALVLSYAPKSECSWSHRRWVIKMIAGKCSNLQEIVEKESELVKKLAEKSKMNYRAWNHRCWLVSYMSKGQVLNELNKSRDWTRLHIADSSCFHYRTRLMLRMLEESWHKQNPIASCSHNAELRQLWKEELDWNEMLIKRYIGREALWLHRRFLSLVWIKHFATDIHDVSSHSNSKDTTSHEIGIFMDNELGLFRSCSTIPDNDFEDFQAHAIFSATYILWLTKQISQSLESELHEKLRVGELETVMNKVCPEKILLLRSFQGSESV
ncbi:uncharacterized protein LOC130753179 isoform X2 [Actinidia eriantha]|uniref:uncharacterized protein LOC130753179 isoform X2 n=1 Tax=Actinidia eriantha TaxID=165200 RepID=UPI00258796DA|nr:uncharacterized protein LOC130753179 isoform X2 [Actinidia eriantha]